MGLNEWCIQEALVSANVLVVPEVVDLANLVEVLCSTHQSEIERKGLWDIVIPVDDHRGKVALLLRTNNVDVLSTVENASGLDTEWVLINGDQLLVFQNCKRARTHIIQITANDERRLCKSPKSHV